MKYEFQPLLDYVLRKYLWFPAFGHQEFGLRFPAFAYSVFAAALVFFIAYRVLRRSPLEKQWATLGAGLIGLWFAYNGLEISYATEARHYSLVLLMSTVWVSSFVFFTTPAGYPIFLTASVLFLNTHFFSYPLVAAGLAYELGKKLRRGEADSARRLAIFAFAAFALSIALNLPAFSRLIFIPPSLGVVDPAFTNRFQSMLDLYQRFFSYLEFPLFSAGVWLFLFAGTMLLFRRTFPRGRERLRRLGLLFFLVVPFTFFIVRSSTNYFFYDRYFTPFFGLGVVLLILLVDSGLVLLQTVMANWPISARNVRRATAVALSALFIFLIQRDAVHWTTVISPNQNFTGTAALFDYVKKRGEPTVFVISPCWAALVVNFYWRFIGQRPHASPAWLRPGTHPVTETDCLLENLDEGQPGARLVERVLKQGPVSVVLFDLMQVCDRAVVQSSDPGVRVRRAFSYGPTFKERSCVFLVEGVKTLKQLREVSQANHLRITQPLSAKPLPDYPNHQTLVTVR